MSKDEGKKKSRKRALVAEAAGGQTIRFVTVGQTLSDRYKLVEELGRGAMGIVFKAEDELLEGMEVAIKVLPPELANDKRSKKRLRKETLAAIKLSHPNILRINGFQEDGDIPYIVMEYLQGHTIEDEAVDREDEVLELPEVLEIAKSVCEALDYAHECGVVHRDIKPTNLIYHKQNEQLIVKVADFGIAYQIKNSVTRLTGYESSGTLYYVAPEQLRGERPQKASDQYSLAATLYELLAGDPPFFGAGMSQQIMSVKPKPIADIPDHVNEALLKALAKKPEDRFESCGELYAALIDEPLEPVVEKTVEESELTVPAVSVDDEPSKEEEQLGKISVKTNVSNATCTLTYHIDGEEKTEQLQLVVEGLWYKFKELENRSYTLLFEADGYISKEIDVKLTSTSNVIEQAVQLESEGGQKTEEGIESLGLSVPKVTEDDEASPEWDDDKAESEEQKGKISVKTNVANTTCALIYYIEGRKKSKYLQLAVEGVWYNFKELESRTYTLVFEAEGYESKEVEVKLSSENSEVQQSIEMTVDESANNVAADDGPISFRVLLLLILFGLLVIMNFQSQGRERSKPKPKPKPPKVKKRIVTRPTKRSRPLRRVPQVGTLIFDVQPPSAKVYIDGFFVSPHKWKGLPRKRGSYKVTAKLAGHYDEVQWVSLLAGEKLTVRIRFTEKEPVKKEPTKAPQPKRVAPPPTKAARPKPKRKGLFSGKKLVNRYQVALVISRFLLKKRLARWTRKHSFTDVDSKYDEAVAISTTARVLEGYDGKFAGRKLINRYQMALILHKLLTMMGYRYRGGVSTAFSDVSRTHWANVAIGHIVELGLMKGYDGKYHGDRLLNRFQLAMIMKALTDKVGLMKTDPALNFPDVPFSHWAYMAVHSLARMGLIQADDMDGTN